MKKEPLLNLIDISKHFGGVKALTKINLCVNEGEVYAIVGENGAGKSTLMKIIAGVLHPDDGKIYWNGSDVEFQDPRDSANAGIAIVHQEPIYFSELSVVENIYLGDEIRSKTGSLDWKQMSIGTKEALGKMQIPLEIFSKTMAELTLGMKQLVLIARAVHRKAKLLILDEPTAILSDRETEILFRTIKKLKEQGVCILYISHRLQEIFQVADHVCVLRDGIKVMESQVEEVDEDDIVKAMTGRRIEIKEFNQNSRSYDNPVILNVENLSYLGSYKDISFSLRKGEILGFYGLVGSGRSEIVRSIYGELPSDNGLVIYKGRKLNHQKISDSIEDGIVFIPEDRRTQGIFPIRSITDNISASKLSKLIGLLGNLDNKKEKSLAQEQVEKMRIKITNLSDVILSLSGGNQQKVILGRGLTLNPQVLILDEPTHGIDVGTKFEIHKLIVSLASQGIGIILISSDLPEIMSLSDRIIVLHEGTIMGDIDRDDASEEKVIRLALGLNGQERISNKEIPQMA